MSLEQAIIENTEALHELIRTLKSQGGVAGANTPAEKAKPDTAEPEAKTETPKKSSTKPTTKPTPTSDQASTTKETESTTSSAADAETAGEPDNQVTYADVQHAVNALVAKQGREVTITTLANQGLKSAKEVEHKPAAWPALIDALQKALG